jgi:hypothetical protein
MRLTSYLLQIWLRDVRDGRAGCADHSPSFRGHCAACSAGDGHLRIDWRQIAQQIEGAGEVRQNVCWA